VREDCIEAIDADQAEVGAPWGRGGGLRLELVPTWCRLILLAANVNARRPLPKETGSMPSTRL